MRRLLVVCSLLAGFVVVGNQAEAETFDPGAASYIPLSPTRITDTRFGTAIDDDVSDPKGVRTDGSELRVPVVGRGGVPADAAGVVLNLTATRSSAVGHVVVYACDTPRPSTSNLNLQPGETVANLVMTKLGGATGAAGEVCLYVRGSTDLVVDIYGYVPAGGSPALVSPIRIVDTRPGMPTDDALPSPKGKTQDGTLYRVPVAGRGGVPADAAGVALNLTATGSETLGFLSVFACDEERPSTSNLNLQPGETVSNLVISKLAVRPGMKGDVCVFARGTTDLIVDIFGYTASAESPTLVRPTRLTDTRADMPVDDSVDNPKGIRTDGSVLRVPVVGRGGVASDATGAVLNVTAVESVAPGFVVVFACDEPRPSTSNLNLQSGETVANLVVSKIGRDGDVCLFVRGSTNLIVDVGGYIAPTKISPPTTTTTSPTSPTTSTSTTSTTTSTSTTTTTPPPPPATLVPFRTFALQPMGSKEYHRELYESAIPAASRMEPVGLYLDQGDVVHITMSGGVRVFAQVGMNGDGRIDRVPIGNGVTQLVARVPGALFLANESTENTATVAVYAAPEIKRIPTFRLGETTDAEFQAQVAAASDVSKVFLIGKYFMTYAHREKYLEPNYITGTTPIITSPTAYIQKRDRDIRMYHEFVGKEESIDFSNANAFQQSREYISTGRSGYMDARAGYINMNGTSPGVMARLFDMDEKPSGKGAAYSAGPWHELGHHQQQYLMAFPNAGEGAPNIYNGLLQLHSGNGYGFGIGRDFLPADIYAGPDAPADATKAKAYHMHYMYMQLFAAYGEGFYHRLHHLYRLIDNDTAANTKGFDEMSLFAYLSSKAAGQDLTPFFVSWKLPINAEYAQKIAALNLPKPKTDLSVRALTEVKSPADLEGNYEIELAPYTNLPVANAKSDFMLRWGSTPSPYDLIDYDPNLVKTAEFLNPNAEPFKVAVSGKPYGATMVEILLTGFDGQQNVVVVDGMIAPESWGPYSLHGPIFNRVYNYVHSDAFQSGNVDLAEAAMNLEMIHGTNHVDTADLIQQLTAAIAKPKSIAHDTVAHYSRFHAITDADTLLYDNRPAVRIDAQLWQDLINTGQLVIRAYETTPKTNPYLGSIRNGVTTFDGNSLNMLDFTVVGSDVVVYLTAPFGSPIPISGGRTGTLNTVEFQINHRDEDNVWTQIPVTMDANRVGATDRISADWVDAQFLPEMTYLENGDKTQVLIYSLPEHSWNTIKAAGDIYLEAYHNGQSVGSTDGTTDRGVRTVISDGLVMIRTPNSGLQAGDTFELKGTFTSRTNPAMSGRIYLKMTANMLAGDLPIAIG